MKYLNEREQQVVEKFIEVGKCSPDNQPVLRAWMEHLVSETKNVPSFIEDYMVSHGWAARRDFYHTPYRIGLFDSSDDNKPHITIGSAR